jgi:two-component system, response regulator PdtaR
MQPPVTMASDSSRSKAPRPLFAPDRSAVPALAGMRVVIVEDEGITQMQLRRMLKLAGLDVVASATGAEQAVEIVLRERPDLVLMDIRMPGPYDGLEAARRILSEYSVCIVMLTAFSEDEYLEKARDLNVCGYVLKPVTSEILIPLLESALRSFGR